MIKIFVLILIVIVCVFCVKKRDDIPYGKAIAVVICAILGTVATLLVTDIYKELINTAADDDTKCFTPLPTQSSTPTPTSTPTPEPTPTPTITRSIKEIKRIEEKFYHNNNSTEDIWGNEYDDYIYSALGGVTLSKEESEEYVTNGEFRKFKGKLFVSEKESKVNEFKMIVYADNTKIYTSPVIKKKSKPQKFKIDISSAEIVKVKFILVKGTVSMLSGWYEESTAYLADGEFY